jgi:(heptosyl)LPS beta-1,4-glucosyltransferase
VSKLTATIITFNEARNIGRCIDSLRDVADEIIVLDSFSTDQTNEICKQKGVKIIQHEWMGFAQTKNYVNRHASFDYILSIDADEALSPELIQSILSVKEDFSGVYSFNRITNYCGQWIRHCGWYPDKKIRIFPNNKALWHGEFIHEKIVFPENLKEDFLKGDLFHYSYYNFDEHYQKIRKYALLSAKQMHLDCRGFFWHKPFLSAISKFLNIYFFRLGFLEGYKGFMIARISAYGSYLKYIELGKIHSPIYRQT